MKKIVSIIATVMLLSVCAASVWAIYQPYASESWMNWCLENPLVPVIEAPAGQDGLEPAERPIDPLTGKDLRIYVRFSVNLG